MTEGDEIENINNGPDKSSEIINFGSKDEILSS